MSIITKNHIIEFAALVVSLIFFNSLKKGKLRSLPFFLLFILCVELLGSYLRTINVSNKGLYNLAIFLEYSYYAYLLWLHGKALVRFFLKIGYPIFCLFVLYYFLLQPFNVLHVKALISGHLLIILSCCFYIYELFRDATEESVFKQYFYWIMSGLLLFNLGDFTYFVFLPLFKANGWDQLDKMFRAVNNQLLLLLNLFYIIAILIHYRYGRSVHARRG